MYIGVVWEKVNSIKAIYIALLLPNTISSSFFYFLSDVC